MREDRDLTQKEMAEILHCSQRVYSNYEKGERDIPTAILIALAQFHNTSTDYILGLTNKKIRLYCQHRQQSLIFLLRYYLIT